MTPQENKAVVERYFDALRRDKSPAALDQYVAEQPLRDHIAFFEAAFPGYWLEADDLIAEADKVVVRFTFRGTHKGELMGIPPTDKTVAVDGIIIYQLKDGKIVEHWMQIDTPGLMQQLGAAPVPA